ncbi:hypothetical protein AB4305_24290 [Nocardia sp. 2YAB30]|uniref:hypothetical protein n=1 Tax=unclassified Nocardia TaxID=2637762 RepID=UPI003F9ABA0F
MAERVRVRRLTDQEGQQLQRIVHGRVIRIGREALRCLLRRRGITFQRTKAWKESPDPERDAELDRIEHVLEHFPDRVFAFDELGSLGIRPTAGSCRAEQGKPDLLPATYRRAHGGTYLYGCYSVGDGTMWGVNRRRKGTAARPDGAPIYIILDNLSAHTGADIRRWAKKNKVELCFTDLCVLGQSDRGALRPAAAFTLANSNHSHHTQTWALHRYLRWRNGNARHPDVLAAQRKERARIRSKKGIRSGGRPLAKAA